MLKYRLFGRKMQRKISQKETRMDTNGVQNTFHVKIFYRPPLKAFPHGDRKRAAIERLTEKCYQNTTAPLAPAFQTTFRDISPAIKNMESLPGFLVPARESEMLSSIIVGGQETVIPVLLLHERKHQRQRGCSSNEIMREWRPSSRYLEMMNFGEIEMIIESGYLCVWFGFDSFIQNQCRRCCFNPRINHILSRDFQHPNRST